MPRKDIYHEQVRKSLEKEGWLITHDPMRFRWKGRTIWPDLGIERVIAAEKGLEKIAVEIKSFLEPIQLHEFYEAIGQYDTYKIVGSSWQFLKVFMIILYPRNLPAPSLK